MRAEQRVLDSTKFLELGEEERFSILSVLGILSEALQEGGDQEIIKLNKEAAIKLLSKNVTTWAMMEIASGEVGVVVEMYPEFQNVFKSEISVARAVKTVENITGISVSAYASVEECLECIEQFNGVEEEEYEEGSYGDFIEDEEGDMGSSEFEGDELSEEIEEVEEETPIKNVHVDGYDAAIHGGFKTQIEATLLNTFEEMYGKFFNGQENIDGFILPTGALEINKNFQGILRVGKKAKVTPNTISNAIYEEFYRACRSCGVEIAKEVESDGDKIMPYKFNPMLQLSIANGSMAGGRPFHSWGDYKEFIRERVLENSQRWAILMANVGSLEPVYKAMSGYTMNLMVINYREGLGSQIRFNCGDNSKTQMVAEAFVRNLKEREKTHKALAMGKMLVSSPVISGGKNCAVISIYQNMAGYQSVPTFMGELLYKMPEGHFKPSIKNMIIGKSLNNDIVTAPFTKWMLPIIAGSRSGKGVLTLNMLLNVVGTGTPLFYLDGKPDMATLLWGLMGRNGIDRAVVVDSVGYEGITPIDKKPYRAPYRSSIGKSLAREGNSVIIENNITAFIYLKTMLAIYLGLEYYKNHMGSTYGDLFVVLDEMYVTFVEKVENIFLDMEIAKKKDKEMAGEVKEIEGWIHGLLNKYSGGDAGIFGAGIKAVALTQWANANMYKTSSTTVNNFCLSFLLRRSVKLYGRQETGGGMYGVSSEKCSPVKFDLYDKYFHFGVGVSNHNTYDTLKTFKPLLVLNENDCKELTGKPQDGVFIDGVIERIKDYVDVPEFRANNFSDPEFARTIGFEGALEQVGRLTGSDWREMLGLSLTRGYDILDEALRFYGLVGVNGVDTVYDYLTDARLSSLASVDDIIRGKAKGRDSEKGEEHSKSMLGGVLVEEDGDEEVIPMGPVVGSAGEVEDAPVRQEMSKEMREFYERKRQKSEPQRVVDEPQRVVEGNPIRNHEPKEFEESYTADNVVPFRKREIETKPEELYYGEEKPAFTREGNVIRLNREVADNEDRVEFTKENYRRAAIDYGHPISKVSKWFSNTAAGAKYEIQSRFKFLMGKLDEVVKPNSVTRMIIGEEEISLNGVFVDISGLVGGNGEARLCDIISFTKILRKYKNLKEMSIDRSMLEAMRYEFRDIPKELFMLNKSLQVLVVMDASGHREVMRRGENKASGMVEKAEKSMEFEAMCNSKNPRVSEKASATYSSVRRGLFSKSKNGATNFLDSVTSKDKSMGRGLINGVASAGLFGLGVVVSVPYAVSRLGSLLKR